MLVHICPLSDWRAAQESGELRPASLAEAGFVHLSTPQQVHIPANLFYSGRGDLLLLRLDMALLDTPDLLGSAVRWEPADPPSPDTADMLFPHLYAPLPTTAVLSQEHYQPGPDGMFPQLTA